MESRQTKTLLVVFNRVGDLTLSAPLFRALAQNTELSLVTRPFGPALLENQSYLQGVYPLPYPNRGRSGVGELLLGGHRRTLGRKLLRAGFDQVLIYESERGVIKRWLDGLFGGRVTELPHRPLPRAHSSELYRAAAVAAGCSMDGYDPDPVLEISPTERQRARARLAAIGGRVVGVQMGSQRTHAVWPLVPRPHLKALTVGQWTALITRILVEDHADAVVMHGSPRERRMVRAVLEQLPGGLRGRCHDFTTVGLDLLPAVLSELKALISLDTGPAHIAAAVGCPLLVFFGPTDPAEFRPLGKGAIEVMTGSAPCQFCHNTPEYGRCSDNVCLNQLSDDDLWAAWLRLHGTPGVQS